MRAIWSIFVILTVSSVPAFAESASDAMRDFGLIGTWSPDCAVDPAGPVPVLRVTYSILSGLPAFSNFTKAGKVSAASEGEIRSAVRVTEDKLRITTVITKTTLTDNTVKMVVDAPIIDSVFVKMGSKIELLDRRSVDGKVLLVQNGELIVRSKDGVETGRIKQLPLEKCLN